MGLTVLVDIKMKLTGIAKNQATLIGIDEDIPIAIGNPVRGKAHFWKTNGDVPLILGHPFLVDFEVHLNFREKYGESMVMLDERGVGLCFPTCDPLDDDFMRALPGHSWKRADQVNLGAHLSKLELAEKVEDIARIGDLKSRGALIGRRVGIGES